PRAPGSAALHVKGAARVQGDTTAIDGQRPLSDGAAGSQHRATGKRGGPAHGEIAGARQRAAALGIGRRGDWSTGIEGAGGELQQTAVRERPDGGDGGATDQDGSQRTYRTSIVEVMRAAGKIERRS